MLLKIDIGVASWMGGIGPGVYFSIVERAGCLFSFAWLLTTSSRHSRRVCFVVWVWGVASCMSRPRYLCLGWVALWLVSWQGGCMGWMSGVLGGVGVRP